MYWKIKLPLILILLAIFSFISYKAYKAIIEKQQEIHNENQPEVVQPTSEPEQVQPSETGVVTPLTAPQPFTPSENPDAIPTPSAFTPAENLTPASPVNTNSIPSLPQTPAPSPTVNADTPRETVVPLLPVENKTTAPHPTASIAQLLSPATQPAVSQQQPTSSEKLPEQHSASQASQTNTAASQQFMGQLKNAQELFEQKKYVEARTAALQCLAGYGIIEYDANWFAAAKLVSDINKTFMYSTAQCPEKETYQVQQGDTLVRIAYRQKTTVQAMMNMNGKLDPRRMYVGRKLSYISGEWSIKVSKSKFTLTLYRNGQLYRIFKVGIGRENRTPVGVFQIRDKIINPAWDSPEGRIPPTDPRNILGTRWMGLEAIEDTNPALMGYGIHGTTLPDTVGTPSSAGCVRLRNEDVEDLYNYIPEPQAAKVRVTIQE